MTESEMPGNGTDSAVRNEDLLARLAEARRGFGPFAQHKELLSDPTIRDLAYRLVEVNQSWIATCVRQARTRFHLRASEEELLSMALSGNGSADAEVGGVLGAILQYNQQRFGVRSFTRYLNRAISNALMPRGNAASLVEAAVPLMECDRDGRHLAWADRQQRQPREQAIDAELWEILHEAIEALPERNRDAARFIVSTIQETGERPTGREVGASRNPPVSKQAGEVLMKQTMDRLAAHIEKRYPQLAEQGIGGWEAFSRVFGIHKHLDAGRER